MLINDYASIKYQNTLRLLGQAKDIERALLDKKIVLTGFQRRRFEQSLASLQLKEQVLGYLEDLTRGRFHREGLRNEELTQYSEWLLAEIPVTPFPAKSEPQAYARLQWLRGYISGAVDKDAAKQEILRTLYVESRPEVPLAGVENLVLAGGGAKALSLAGVVQSIEEYQKQNELPIKRVAGTSGGAIMAMGYAIGYSADELKKVVMDNAFGLFTMESRLSTPWIEKMAHWFAKDKPSSPLHALSDNVMARYYQGRMLHHTVEYLMSCDRVKDMADFLAWLNAKPESREERIQRVINSIPGEQLLSIDAKSQRDTVAEHPYLAKEGGVHLYASPRQALLTSMRSELGIDVIRGFFSDLLLDKLRKLPAKHVRRALSLPENALIHDHRLRNITFSELKRLHDAMPDVVKELHISMCIEQPLSDRFSGKTYNKYRHENASHDHPIFADLPVADAVRVSMNLPWIYPAYPLSLKGKKYMGSDGGILSNMSMSTFDKDYPPEKTLGVFYKTKSELMTIYDVNRILVLPRSEMAIKQEIVQISRTITEAEHEWQELKERWERDSGVLNEAHPLAQKLRHDMFLALEKFRVASGQRSALQRELSSLAQYDQADLNWSQKLSIKPLLEKYLSKKNKEVFGGVHDLRRLVMINTGKVDTKDFKLPLKQKDDQVRYGYSAMNALLRGTYCLENHFYFHMLLNLSYSNGVSLDRFNIHSIHSNQQQPMKEEMLTRQFDMTTDTKPSTPSNVESISRAARHR